MLIKKVFKKIFLALRVLLTRQITIELDRIPYKIKNLSYKKIFNWILVNLSEALKTQNPWGYPTHAQIEPSSLCNLKCVFCPVTSGMDREHTNLDFRIFKKLIDEIGDYLFAIVLWDWGEPFLNPDLINIIKYAKAKNIKIVTSTNGHFFFNIEKVDSIIKSGIDSIIIAVDGINQDTYDKFRKGGNIDKVISGIKLLTERKKALNSATPLIHIRTVATILNETELNSIKQSVASLGVDAFSIKSFDYFYSDNQKDRQNKLLPEDKRLWRWKIDENGLPLRRKSNPCNALWVAALMHSNGCICPCWMDSNEKYPIGNLNDSSFREIWFSDKFKKMRKEFKQDWTKYYYCNNCTFAYEGGSCTGETIVEVTFFDNHK